MLSIKPAGTPPLKYVVGIDMAKSSFVACLGRLDLSQQLSFSKEVTFDNTLSGFTALLAWVGKQQSTARCGSSSRPRASITRN